MKVLAARLACVLSLLLLSQSAARAQDGTGSAGGTSAGSQAQVSTHAAAPTTSQTTTHSGPAPASTATVDGATEPVIDPVTAPPRTAPPPEEEEEAEGDGRDIDYLWIEAQGGVSNVNLIQFQNTAFADVAAGGSVFREVYGTGPVIGLGVGFRVWWIAVGARASFALYDTFQIGTIGGEVTLRLPVPIVEPWVRVGFGYGWQGEASYGTAGVSARSTTTYGWAFQSGLGLDIYLTNWLTIGAGVGLDILNMTRQRDPSVMCMAVTDVCPGNNGDALGLQIKGLLTVGFRF